MREYVVIRKTPKKSVMQDVRDMYIGEVGTAINTRGSIIKLKFDDGCSVWFRVEEVQNV